MRLTYLLSLLFIAMLISCNSDQGEKLDLTKKSWEDIGMDADGTDVQFMMWQGSPSVNGYINNYVVPELKERYNINLKISGGQGPEIVQLIMGEKQAGVANGQVDMVWINGETFFQLRQIDGLWGPFVEKLPNAKYIDFDNKYINTDFQQPVNGMECPWGLNQFVMVYDSMKTPEPPRNIADLETFIKANPGTFTISNDFTGMTLLKCLMAEMGGSPTSLDGPFDEEKYIKLSSQLWDFINRNRQYLWKEGSTFPTEQSKMSQMFASGELLLAYGFSEGSIEERVLTLLYPKTVRGYAFDNGTIRNSNYLGIPYNAKNKQGAMKVINFMISPDAQLEKSRVDGMNSLPVIDYNRLSEEEQEAFDNMPKRQYGPTLDDLTNSAIQEPAPEYMIRLYEDFRKQIIEK